MKKYILSIILIAIIVPVLVWAGDSIGKGSAMTSSGLAVKGKVAITQLLVTTDGTNNVTVAAYNSATAGSGDQITAWTCSGAALTCAQDWPIPRDCDKGIWIVITTSGTANVFPEWQYRN